MWYAIGIISLITSLVFTKLLFNKMYRGDASVEDFQGYGIGIGVTGGVLVLVVVILQLRRLLVQNKNQDDPEKSKLCYEAFKNYSLTTFFVSLGAVFIISTFMLMQQ